MLKSISSIKKSTGKSSIVFIIDNVKNVPTEVSKEIQAYISKQKNDFKLFTFENIDSATFILNTAGEKNTPALIEKIRIQGCEIFQTLKKKTSDKVEIISNSSDFSIAITEGTALSAYSFDKYLTEKEKFHLTINVIGYENEVNELNEITNGVNIARDFVNEPQNYLTATQYSKDIEKLAKDAGFKLTVLEKKEIEKLKMGGLLAVNQGSVEPPTFNILEWKPKNATNSKPIVLVGKGVVYDTGGLSLKPTPQSMDIMKCDMGGSASVVGALYSISKNKLPVHVIGIIAATDNRPSLNAYAPGDVISMYNKKTVEVLNTDAEGRLTLGDAISYSLKFKPELIIDIATLTGAAARAIGKNGAVMMGTASEKTKNKLKESGFNTHERLVEFPLWEEYKEELKSDIADITNLGGAEGGATTAGIFLEYFAEKTPWIHIDIAGTAWLGSNDKYRVKNGTGTGVRLFYDFVKNWK